MEISGNNLNGLTSPSLQDKDDVLGAGGSKQIVKKENVADEMQEERIKQGGLDLQIHQMAGKGRGVYELV